MKINVFFALVLLIGIFGCKSEPKQAENSIEHMETAMETNPSDSLTQALIAAYRDHVKENPEDTELNAKYLYRAGGLFYRKNQYPNAAAMLLQAIQMFPTATTTSASQHLLADIYNDHMRNGPLAGDLYQGLIDHHPAYGSLDKVKAKMTPSPIPLADRIDTLITTMYNNETHFLDRRKAAQYVMACEVFAIVNPKDPKAPELLLKAAETSRTIRNFPKALNIYDLVYNNFSDYEKAGQALFLKAFTLDNDMKQYELARPIYETFLEKYPNDVFAKDTKFLLENLGKSDNEIINNFNK